MVHELIKHVIVLDYSKSKWYFPLIFIYGVNMDNKIKSFIKELKNRISEAQYAALKLVNKEQIQLYWDIGKMIVEKQETLGWGKSVVKNVSDGLREEFPGIMGFSTDNLWRMRKFFLHYKENLKLAPLVQEISWTKNVVIIERCKDDL